ncbi:MAG: hypothetical protein JWO03_444 [Bacteroidetes bacterium]|nr:hypothetical protein [Bacteroidota bacterium]
MTHPPKPYTLRILLILAVLCLCKVSYGQYTEIKGNVIDSKEADSTMRKAAYASILLKGTTTGTTADGDGFFYIRTLEKSDSLIVGYVGNKIAVRIQRGQSQIITIDLSQGGHQLPPVIVKGPKHPPKHIDTPAVYVYRQVVAHKSQNREDNLPSYRLQEYQKLDIGLINPKKWLVNLGLIRPFRFVFKNQDTALAYSGFNSFDTTLFVPGLLKEDMTDVYYRRDPKTIRQITTGSAFSGISNKSIGSLLNYTFDRINVYDDIFLLVQKSFVSPFAPSAQALTYDYFLRDTVKMDGRTTYKLNFVGKSKVDLALQGYAWIDSATWAIKSIEMRPNLHANLNYLKEYTIKQSYTLVGNIWMLKTEDLQTEGAIFKGSKTFNMAVMIKKHLSRKNIELNPVVPDSIFRGVDQEVIVEGARERSHAWWDSTRLDQLSHAEKRVIEIHDTLPKMRAYKTWLWVIQLATTADFKAGPVEFGRFYKFVSFNDVEGVRLRLGIQTNEDFSKKIHLFGYGAYGTRDHVFKYNITSHFVLPSINDRWRQLELFYQYDLNELGQQNQLLTFDNIFSSIGGRPSTLHAMKIREWGINLENEWLRGFSSTMSIHNMTYYAIPGKNEFIYTRKSDNTQIHLPNFDAFEIGVDSRYSYKDKYYKAGFYRFFIATKNPVFLLNYKLGFLTVNGNRSVYSKLQATVKQRLSWTLGHTWYQIQAGKIFGLSPYPLSYVTPGGFGYLLNNVDYNMLSPFEFVTDQYISVYLEHHFDGYFFNKIPYVNRLQLREVIYARALWGSYNSANKNLLNPGPEFNFNTPSKYPYVEAGFGFENIVKVLRLDFIWRVTYRDNKLAKNFLPKFSIAVAF